MEKPAFHFVSATSRPVDVKVERVVGNAKGPEARCQIIGQSNARQQQDKHDERHQFVTPHCRDGVVESLEDGSEGSFYEQSRWCLSYRPPGRCQGYLFLVILGSRRLLSW